MELNEVISDESVQFSRIWEYMYSMSVTGNPTPVCRAVTVLSSFWFQEYCTYSHFNHYGTMIWTKKVKMIKNEF